jgi:hypothetical protein
VPEALQVLRAAALRIDHLEDDGSSIGQAERTVEDLAAALVKRFSERVLHRRRA